MGGCAKQSQSETSGSGLGFAGTQDVASLQAGEVGRDSAAAVGQSCRTGCPQRSNNIEKGVGLPIYSTVRHRMDGVPAF
jgi:hypothetical protein